MARIAKAHGKLKAPVETLIGSYFGQRVWLMADTVAYLHKLGVKVLKIYECAQFDRLRRPPFDWFAEIVSEPVAEPDYWTYRNFLGHRKSKKGRH